MQVQISGKHVDIGDALRERIGDELKGAIGKYFERGGDAEVVVSREAHNFRVDCTVHLASGQMLKSHGLAHDAHAAFSLALEKVETRIRRYKRRLKSHSIAASAKQAEMASLYILRSPDSDEESGHDHDVPDAEQADEHHGAMIIAESEAELKTMTVSMAVMELDLTESQAVVFRNVAHGGLAVVYRRPDGHIGWIDPQRTRPQ